MKFIRRLGLLKVLYVCPLAHLTGHPPFECTKETGVLQENGVDVQLLTFCGVHEGFQVVVPQTKVMRDNGLFRSLRSHFVTQWMLRVFEYTSTVLKACSIAKDRPIYLRDAEPFPHFVHLVNLFAHKKWTISSTGGLYTTGSGVSKFYKLLLRMTTVNCKFWYRISRNRIQYSVQDHAVKQLMQPLLGDRITVVPLGHKLIDTVPRDEARKRLGLSLDTTVLLALGVNHSGKDPETVFRGLQGLHNVVLIHAGATVQSTGMRPDVLKNMYSANSMIINRQIGNEEKRLLFGAADWVVLSYDKSFSSTTSMLWEACAHLVPVIASSGTRLEELVKYWNVGLVFEASNPRDFRAHLSLAMQNGRRASLASNCKDFISFYSESVWCQQTIKLLESQ